MHYNHVMHTPKKTAHPISISEAILSRETAVAGFKQVKAASEALNKELAKSLPDGSVIIACMRRGAVLELLPNNNWGWIERLINDDNVEVLQAILDGQPVRDAHVRLKILANLATHGSQAMFEAIGALVNQSKQELFNALERAVDENHLDTVPRLLALGAPLLDPNPIGYEQKRVGNNVPTIEMFELLLEHGYAFNKSDLLRSCLSSSGRYVSLLYRAPKPKLLAHMIARGVSLVDSSIPGMPFPVLLNQNARALLYREEMAQCARILLDHDVPLSLGYGTHLPALLVLSDAGMDSDSIFEVADSAQEWPSWRSKIEDTLGLGSPEEDLMAARNLLLALDVRGVTMERLLQNTKCPCDWGEAFCLAGCEVETDFNPNRLNEAGKQLREAAKLQRATPAVAARKNAVRL